MRKLLTLCIVHQHPRVLLGMKKRGLGEGRWNGFGGKVEEGESIEAAARREIEEEAGLKAKDLEKAGIMEFRLYQKPDPLEVHIFRVEDFLGEPRESEEMSPRWFLVDEIPFKDMWAADRYWFPLFFRRRKFRGHVVFDINDNVIEREILETNIL